MVNGEDPVITEIEALESRNRELEESLQSYKRSNEQLNSQVNEQVYNGWASSTIMIVIIKVK